MRFIVLAVAALLTACAPGGDGHATTASIDGAWIATSIGGRTVAPPNAVTMTIAGAQVFGNSGCNSYGGGVQAGDGRIKFGDLAMTMMACLDQGRMQQEQAFHVILKDAETYVLPATDKLEVTAQGGRVVAFKRKP